MSSAYHPQTDGQSEAVNKWLEMFLRCFTFNNPKSWYKALNWAEYWYNIAYHMSLGMTPFKALYGRDPPMLVRYTPDSNDPPDLQEQLLLREVLLAELKDNLSRAQHVMKNQADKRTVDLTFEVGEQVLVKLQPYRQSSTALRKNQKLGMRYFGPFTVIAKIGKVAYKLQFPPTARIYSTFHVSQLKPFKGVTTEPYVPMPLTTSEVGPIIQPAAILKSRTIIRGDQQIPQVLVKWQDFEENEATWEDKEEMALNYPNFNLEDKVIVNGDGNVMKPNAEVDKVTDESAEESGPRMKNDAEESGTRRSNRIRKEHPM